MTDLFKKVVNWIFKGAGKKMGPYFLFITAGATLASKISKNKEIRRRMGEQPQLKRTLTAPTIGRFT